ncbi:hypothetical protein GCM10009101_07010 [Brevundimonas lenta]
MRAIRKTIAMTQLEMAERLGVSRKTIVAWEGSVEPLAEGVALQVLDVAGQIRVLTNTFRVEPTMHSTYAVVHRRHRQMPHQSAMYYTHSEAMLMGEFRRRTDAYRWCNALQLTANPRNTRELLRQRRRESEQGVVG